jgi:hypothetical protein
MSKITRWFRLGVGDFLPTDEGTKNATGSTVALNTAIGTTAEIKYTEVAGGMVMVPAASSITSITWWAAPYPGGTYEAVVDGAGSEVATTIAADQSAAIPSALFGAGAIKGVVNSAGSVQVSLKS